MYKSEIWENAGKIRNKYREGWSPSVIRQYRSQSRSLKQRQLKRARVNQVGKLPDKRKTLKKL